MSPSFRRNRWLLLLLLFGLCFLGLSGWAVQRAVRGVSPVAEPGYYKHGLHYGHILRSGEAADALGWRLDVEVNRGRLVARLFDREGNPVSGIRGGLQFPGEVALPALLLNENAAGLYHALLPAGLRGEVAALLVMQHGEAGVRRQLLLHL